jgi:serine/threonine protein kinase
MKTLTVIALVGLVYLGYLYRSYLHGQEKGASHTDFYLTTTTSTIQPANAFMNFLGKEIVPLPSALGVVGKLPPGLRQLYFSQRKEDFTNINAAPIMDQHSETPIIAGEQKVLNLGKPISKQVFSTIFSVMNDADVVVKYQCDCAYLNVLHPLLREFWALRTLIDTEIVPRSFFLSPAIGIPPTVSEKTDFKLAIAERENCVKKGGVVRYMVIERLAMSVYDMAAQCQLTVTESLKILREMIKGIEVMHKRGIIHGDIHPGNVMFASRSDHRSVRFIDFGNSIRAEELKIFPIIVRKPMEYIHCYLSHWNLLGYRLSYRDDVFKALFVTAVLMNGADYIRYCRTMTGELMLRHKEQEFLFEYPGGRQLESSSEVKVGLEKILKIVRRLELDELPPYGELIDEISTLVD